MATNYDEIATEYKRAREQPWCLHVEHFTLFKLLGDLHDKTADELLENVPRGHATSQAEMRFVSVNNNPNHKTDDFMSTRKYGFVKQAHSPMVDGTAVDYVIFLDDGSFAITNGIPQSPARGIYRMCKMSRG